jgi:beta-glucosidase
MMRGAAGFGRTVRRASGPLALGLALASVSAPAAASAQTPPHKDPGQPVSVRVDDLLSRMSLEEKLGQMTQAERKVVTPDDLADHGIGSILSGGGSAPTPNTAASWADMYDSFQRGALRSRLGIPILYGIDAVHGHNNVHNATIFPHNIGLGAARDSALIRRIGRATAEEVAGTGIDWDFAPCLCVARNDRWGRTYESFGETPDLASSMSTLITGLQGTSLGGPASVLATAKHYLGDGGTTGGDDQGNTELSEAELRAIHLPPFKAAIARGVGSVMASYSSWKGVKMHDHRYLLTDVLKGELGFRGFVVSDWEAIDQIDGQPGFTAEEIRRSINAGIDMVMVPFEWRKFLDLLRAEVRAGRISMARIDDANRRILTKKLELGLFERPFTDRSYTSTVGSAEHRVIARDAVRKSQVLLMNKYGILPLPKTASKIFVAGKSADDIGLQSGGWTMEWQGGSGPITAGTTILQGIRNAVSPQTTVTHDREGDGIDGTYNAAIAVVGERPYAEYHGDRTDDLRLDAEDLSTLSRLKAAGVPVVVVLVSGRPLDVTDELAGWDALVAAWLPGSEGAGVADVLFGHYDPTGKLPVTWPRSAAQEPINAGDDQSPLFAQGAGKRFPASQPADRTIGAAYYDEQRGTLLERCSDSGCGQNVGSITPGDHLAYADVDFGSVSPTAVLTRLASGAALGHGAPGTIEYRLDSPTGPRIATVPIQNTGGWQSWQSRTVPLERSVTGIHKLYLTFTGATDQDIGNLSWFQFGNEPITPTTSGEEPAG